MTPQIFIEKAIEGGWTKGKVKVQIEDSLIYLHHPHKDGEFTTISLFEVLLDPLAWQAVGKIEGWNESSISMGVNKASVRDFGWKNNMHRMIDSLSEGKSIEEFLETL